VTRTWAQTFVNGLWVFRETLLIAWQPVSGALARREKMKMKATNDEDLYSDIYEVLN